MTPTKIALLGTSGAGKTTLGRALAARLAAPFVECDAIRHKANWVSASDEELRAGIDAVIGRSDRWVIDGTFQRQLGDFITGRADLLVWLDLPLLVKLARAARRSWRRLRTDEELWNGNRETWRDAFFARDSVVRYAIRAHFRDRRALPRPEHAHKTLRLRSVGEVERWLAMFAESRSSYF
ncbi:MAG TPA: shikimate kinase [Polyangia bacterium]